MTSYTSFKTYTTFAGFGDNHISATKELFKNETTMISQFYDISSSYFNLTDGMVFFVNNVIEMNHYRFILRLIKHFEKIEKFKMCPVFLVILDDRKEKEIFMKLKDYYMKDTYRDGVTFQQFVRKQVSHIDFTSFNLENSWELPDKIDIHNLPKKLLISLYQYINRYENGMTLSETTYSYKYVKTIKDVSKIEEILSTAQKFCEQQNILKVTNLLKNTTSLKIFCQLFEHYGESNTEVIKIITDVFIYNCITQDTSENTYQSYLNYFEALNMGHILQITILKKYCQNGRLVITKSNEKLINLVSFDLIDSGYFNNITEDNKGLFLIISELVLNNNLDYDTMSLIIDPVLYKPDSKNDIYGELIFAGLISFLKNSTLSDPDRHHDASMFINDPKIVELLYKNFPEIDSGLETLKAKYIF